MNRPCLDCRRVFIVERRKQSRCPSCEALRRAALPPRDAEPWRAIYRMRQWWKARAQALARDDHRCRAVLAGQRCQTTSDLEVHHDPPLEALWQRASCADEFVELACDLRHLFTLCKRHHARADALRRRIPQMGHRT